MGYLMKNVTARELAGAIRSAYHGKMTLSPEAAQALVHARPTGARDGGADRARARSAAT